MGVAHLILAEPAPTELVDDRLPHEPVVDLAAARARPAQRVDRQTHGCALGCRSVIGRAG